MFQRDYMEYHASRFADASIVVRRGRKMVAAIPGNRAGNVFYSHQGLTFGGLIVGRKIYAADVLMIMEHMTAYLKDQGYEQATIKVLPAIFSETAREECLYGLTRNGWTLSRRDLSSAIEYAAETSYRSTKRHAVRKAAQNGLDVVKATVPDRLWQLIAEVLKERHDTSPTHTRDEIADLAKKFPQNIIFYEVCQSDILLGGAVIFLNGSTIHTQYLAVSDEGRLLGGLDYLLDHLITTHRKTHRWFSFGISTTEGGEVLNESLLFQKEGFGARGIVHDFYTRSF